MPCQISPCRFEIIFKHKRWFEMCDDNILLHYLVVGKTVTYNCLNRYANAKTLVQQAFQKIRIVKSVRKRTVFCSGLNKEYRTMCLQN